MHQFRQEHPRVIGLIVLLLGVGGAFWAYSAYRTAGSISDYVILFPPLLLIYGLAVMLEPRFTLVWEDSSIERRYKVISILILVMGLAAGFYVRFVVFKNWK